MNTFHFIGLVGGAGAPESWMTESFFLMQLAMRAFFLQAFADIFFRVYSC